MQRELLRDDAGTPLGVGYPSGSPLRFDGESHHEAWRRICRVDPCAYCGARWSGTLDHIEPQRGARPARGLGGVHTWLNYAGACERCNNAKRSRPMLLWLLGRGGLKC